MFKAARWRSEKNRIKAVFELQFQATQVPKLGWEKLMVTLVPMDVGRPTVKSEKAAVIDGACYWANPIYETVKLTQDPKNGKINDKVYQFLVSATGSTKSGLLGEITINLADYAEAFKPSSVSLPLKASNTGAILHVTLQRMQGGVEGRDADGSEDLTVRKQGKTLQSQLSICENGRKVPNDTNEINSTKDDSLNNRQAQVKFPSSRSIPLHADSNGNLRKSSSFDAISASGSESSSGQYTPKENEIKNNNYQDSGSLLSPLSNSDTPRMIVTSSSDSITNTDWSASSAPNGSMGGSTNSSGETGSEERLQESDDIPDKLSSGGVTLQRQLEVSELELQTLRKQVVKENRRGQDLSRELSSLKEERDALRRECEELKASQKRKIGDENVLNKLQFDGEDPWSMLEEIKQELNYEKNTSANLRLQLQKTQESNSELILAVRDLEELLEQKNSEISCINCSVMPVKPVIDGEIKEAEFGKRFSHLQHSESKQELFETTSENEEQYALDVLVKEPDDGKVACALEQKIIDLNIMVELYKKDREDILMEMEQLALDYEILKQENHDISSKLEQTQLREQLRMQYECSAHLAIINDLEAHVESLEQVLQKQDKAFEADLTTITNAKIEQEKRAIQAEEALRKTRLNNTSTAERLQEEFKTLSAQMSSTFYANEKLVMQTLAESSELRLQKSHLEELLEKTNKELASVKGQCHVKFQQLLSLIDFKTKEADRLFLELKDKQQELEKKKKSEDKRQKAYSEEMVQLKAEMEKLSREKNHLSGQIEHKEKLVAEMERMKRLIKENEMLLQERNLERNMLQIELASMREEANKSLEERNDLKHIKDEQETIIRNLTSELTTLRVQYNDLKHTLLEDELEKENLRQQALKLRGNLQKNEATTASFEKKLKDSNAELTDPYGATKTSIGNKGNISGTKPRNSNEVSSLYEKIQLLEGERKLKDAVVEELRNSLLQKEKDYSNKVEEMERSTREFNTNNSGLWEGIVHKGNLFGRHGNMPEDEKVIASNLDQLRSANLLEECNVNKNVMNANTNDVRNNGDYLLQTRMEDKACMYNKNDIDRELIISNLGAHTEIEEESLVSCTCDQHKIDGVLSEMTLLKERNQSMEAELKEMQERYSEISLKFAEVEGERQQLVITIRTLRNALKN